MELKVQSIKSAGKSNYFDTNSNGSSQMKNPVLKACWLTLLWQPGVKLCGFAFFLVAK
jgi:hypothetical protein